MCWRRRGDRGGIGGDVIEGLRGGEGRRDWRDRREEKELEVEVEVVLAEDAVDNL